MPFQSYSSPVRSYSSPVTRFESKHLFNKQQPKPEELPNRGAPDNSWPKIFKVPQAFRADNESAFEPQIVSIGPYHHGKPHLNVMEATKRQYQDDFFTRSPPRASEDCSQRIRVEIGKAKACYLWDATPAAEKDEEFLEMLLVDGCFILEYMLRVWEPIRTEKNANFDPIFHVNWTHIPLLQDLFLKLENQVPFFILKSIYGDIAQPSLDLLAFHCLPQLFKPVSLNDKDNFLQRVRENPPYHLLHFLHSCITIKHRNYVPRPTEIERIPSAQELIEAGLIIKAKKKKDVSMMHVSYNKGVLEMTPLVFNDHTIANFHNLVAFEQGCPAVGGYVTVYCLFVDCLVDTSTDVQLLRRAKVLVNHIGSDDELALLVNRLCKNVTVTDYTLSQLLVDVNKYCNRRWPRWRANLVGNYFSNPWSIISLAAAVVLLLLTMGQMYFAILSYVRPPK